MRFRSLLLVLALLAAPAPLVGQQAPPKGPHHHRGPVERLIRDRDSLSLSDEQVARLEEIRARMEEVNRPLVERLVDIRQKVHARVEETSEALSAEERKALIKRGFREGRPLMEQIRRNNREAMREVGTVLTPEQRSKLREMIERRGEKGGPHRGRGRDRGHFH